MWAHCDDYVLKAQRVREGRGKGKKLGGGWPGVHLVSTSKSQTAAA